MALAGMLKGAQVTALIITYEFVLLILVHDKNMILMACNDVMSSV